MNALLIFSVAPLAVLGAVLITLGYFGWGISLWTIAIALSQASFLADVWAEYKSQAPDGRDGPADDAADLAARGGRLAVCRLGARGARRLAGLRVDPQGGPRVPASLGQVGGDAEPAQRLRGAALGHPHRAAVAELNAVRRLVSSRLGSPAAGLGQIGAGSGMALVGRAGRLAGGASGAGSAIVARALGTGVGILVLGFIRVIAVAGGIVLGEIADGIVVLVSGLDRESLVDPVGVVLRFMMFTWIEAGMACSAKHASSGPEAA
ncbi:hypothetical protein Ddc_20033 [Ditylenchus destructor]|nr:hypothetical protein Ddc_20033 [Ditylenchus destructor]